MSDDQARNDVSIMLRRLEDGDPAAAEDLLPVVYKELRGLAKLAAQLRPRQLEPAVTRRDRDH